jgi:subtilisin family serine protease
VLVSFSGSVSPQAVVGIAQSQRLTLLGIHRLALIDATLYRFRITDGRSVPAVIASFGGDRRISRAQPNYLYTAQHDAGDDVRPASGDPAQYVLGKLMAPQAHGLARGDHVLVAVIDSGIDPTHPDLLGMLAARFDATGTPDRPHRHGTAMAGAIAAHGKLLGIAPGARILAARAFDQTAGGAASTTTRLLDSLQWASDAGARIINMSFAGPPDPRLQEMIAAARRKGATPIAAAGNEGPSAQPAYPAAYPEVIAVTATDINDQAFGQSNRGRHVAVAAPGVDILVAAPNGSYDLTTGTSVAAAHVSGIAALLLDRHPGLTPEALQAVLLRTAKDLGAPGRDEVFGAGLVNAYDALTALAPQTAERTPAH